MHDCHLFHLNEFSFCVTKLQGLSIISYHDREIIISQETILSQFFKAFQFSDSRTKQQTRLPFSSKQGRTHDRSISSSSPINLHASSGSKLPSIKRDDNLSHCKEPKRARLIFCTMAILSSGLALIRPSLSACHTTLRITQRSRLNVFLSGTFRSEIYKNLIAYR